jgi:tRNA(fMet)-specific endonuclease VapC
VLVLDTDHLVEIDRGSALGAALMDRLDRSGQEIVTTIVSAEEQLRGWLAQINQLREPHAQIAAYSRLQGRLAFFAAWRLLQWNADAADRFRELRGQGVRIGAMDLKIASIVLANNATLLSRNLSDFRKVPSLRVEDWLSSN